MQSRPGAAEAGDRRPPVMLADLNVDPPPESEGIEEFNPAGPAASPFARINNEETGAVKVGTAASDSVDCEDAEQQGQGTSALREEKVTNLKIGLINVARKMPKNAHAHFILGLMYQRLGHPQKAIGAFEKATDILLQDEEEVRRPNLLSLVRLHHAQCVVQSNMVDCYDEELGSTELDGIVVKLRKSIGHDPRQAVVWNSLGLVLLRTGRLQSAIYVFSSILADIPEYSDSLANLGIAYLQSGNLELSAKCFHDLVLKDQNHPTALVNYAAFVLCKYGSIIEGPGACLGNLPYSSEKEAIHVAKECLIVAAKADPKATSIWLNLANAYYIAGEHKKAKMCLEQAAKLDPNQMAARFAIAVHRIKDADRSQFSSNQLTWAANEMATILKEGEPLMIDIPIARAGLAMAHATQCEIAAAFEREHADLTEAGGRTLTALKQAIQEDPDDAVHWNQLGLHSLCTMQFAGSVKFLKAAVGRSMECSYGWSNLGVALQLSGKQDNAEAVYKRALALSSSQHTHAILSNLGILYRFQRRYELAKKILLKSLDLCPGYAPALNNLGLVFAAEGCWGDAATHFERALQSDPLLDAAKSNLSKAVAFSRAGGAAQ